MSRRAYPSGIGYQGFPKAICSSVNEVVVHGIPDYRPLQEGDIVNYDITCFVDGVFGDCSMMVEIGDIDQKAKSLISVSRSVEKK